MSAEAGSKLTLLREPVLTVGGVEVLAALRSALAWLQANQEEINDLNVFPVPDGDTGSNMYLTLRSAVEEAQAAADPSSAAVGARRRRPRLADGRARQQRGDPLAGPPRPRQGVGARARLDAAAWARGLAEARTVAYKAVMKPTEGTILTVVTRGRRGGRRAPPRTATTSSAVSSRRCGPATPPSSGPPSSSRCCATPASSTPAASASR